MVPLDHTPTAVADMVIANVSLARLVFEDTALPHQQETCLSCGEVFTSNGSKNRVCPACKARQEVP